jgi:hypothetical protein
MEMLATPWGFASISVISMALIVIIWRVGYLSLSKAGILIGKSSLPKVSPHAKCPYAGDIVELIYRTTEYIESRQERKNILLEEQMRFYEETAEEIQGTMKYLFLSILSKKLEGVDSYVQHPEYTAYTVTLMAIAVEIKSYVRTAFKANHYAELSMEEQIAYIDKKCGVVMQKVTEGLNVYWRGRLVTRPELYAIHKENMPILEESVNTIFNRAFKLARTTYADLDAMEKDYSAYIKYTLGKEDSCIRK